MQVRNIKWILLIALAVLLTIVATLLFQNWQRSHFVCSGELLMEYPDIRGDVSIKYVFDGSKGVAILRGQIFDNNGDTLEVNHNVWFSFTRKGNDYFLASENVSSSTGGTNLNPMLKRTLPDFYLKAKEPFYLSILRLNSSTWQFYTSRSPSVFCRR